MGGVHGRARPQAHVPGALVRILPWLMLLLPSSCKHNVICMQDGAYRHVFLHNGTFLLLSAWLGS